MDTEFQPIEKLSPDARYEGAWEETAARIEARDGVLFGFVQLAAALIGASLADEKLEYVGVLVGYAAFIAASLTAHHDVIIGKLGSFQSKLSCHYGTREDQALEWFSKKNFTGVFWAKTLRDFAQLLVLSASCIFGLVLSYNPHRVPQSLGTHWIGVWWGSLVFAIFAVVILLGVFGLRMWFWRNMGKQD